MVRDTQEDPIGLAGGMNLYGYAGGDPVNNSDPFGLCFFKSDDSCFQLLANWGASTGREWAVTAGATAEAGMAVAGALLGMDAAGGDCGADVACAAGPSVGKPPLGAIKTALKAVHEKVGKFPKGEPGKFGSPQRGTAKKGYRLDPAHPNRPAGDPESGPHINWWDWTKGKRGSGGESGAVRVQSPQQRYGRLQAEAL